MVEEELATVAGMHDLVVVALSLAKALLEATDKLAAQEEDAASVLEALKDVVLELNVMLLDLIPLLIGNLDQDLEEVLQAFMVALVHVVALLLDGVGIYVSVNVQRVHAGRCGLVVAADGSNRFFGSGLGGSDVFEHLVASKRFEVVTGKVDDVGMAGGGHSHGLVGGEVESLDTHLCEIETG